VEVCETSGFARRNWRWVSRGQAKGCRFRPLRSDAIALLAAGGVAPPAASASHDDRTARMVDLNQVVIDGESGLFAKLRAITDHRSPITDHRKVSAISWPQRC